MGGAVDGGDCVCGVVVTGVDGAGGGTGVTGVTGRAGEAGVGGGVAVILTVEAVDIVDTEPELWVCDTPPLMIPLTDVTVAELGNDGSPPENSKTYRKVPKFSKFSDAKKLCCNLSKFQTKRPNLRVFCQKDANGIANSEDPD